jgi:hypothetical protein
LPFQWFCPAGKVIRWHLSGRSFTGPKTRNVNLPTLFLQTTGGGTTETLKPQPMIISHLFSKPKISGSPWDRIYNYHIRKTGGTSLNHMLLGSDGEDPEENYKKLVSSPGNHLIEKGRGFVGWNKKSIEKGNYFCGFSHEPFYQLRLPPRTFTLTCFRDPFERIFSHYRMLRE